MPSTMNASKSIHYDTKVVLAHMIQMWPKECPSTPETTPGYRPQDKLQCIIYDDEVVEVLGVPELDGLTGEWHAPVKAVKDGCLRWVPLKRLSAVACSPQPSCWRPLNDVGYKLDEDVLLRLKDGSVVVGYCGRHGMLSASGGWDAYPSLYRSRTGVLIANHYIVGWQPLPPA